MAEKTVMLCCSAGMSTSMLVKKMQEAAKKDGLDYEIFACPAAEADTNLENKNISCVLLGPQVRYMLADFEKKVEGKNIPVEVIDMAAYGMMDGEKVVQQAKKLVG
ncbi:PTS sugar transporter subunit IIB [Lactobacillus sp.]|uniref:PTS sugar transporter subunit IIB n=1 Tax=Lactobacillus sp. TaxID=1591 RepID=UPI003EF605A9